MSFVVYALSSLLLARAVLANIYTDLTGDYDERHAEVTTERRYEKMSHITCRDPADLVYADGVVRSAVPNNSVPWDVPWETYAPTYFTAKTKHDKHLSDPEDVKDVNFKPNWNFMDGPINRISYMGFYKIVDGHPVNPIGRTGLAGRGSLPRWGPNHRVVLIISRWKRRFRGMGMMRDYNTRLPFLQYIALQKTNRGKWYFPTNDLLPGELLPDAMNRTFVTDVLDTSNSGPIFSEDILNLTSWFYTKGDLIYRGYTDDPQNTDNAWVETVAVQFHDSWNEYSNRFHIKDQETYPTLRWLDASQDKDSWMMKQDFDLLKETARMSFSFF